MILGVVSSFLVVVFIIGILERRFAMFTVGTGFGSVCRSGFVFRGLVVVRRVFLGLECVVRSGLLVIFGLCGGVVVLRVVNVA